MTGFRLPIGAFRKLNVLFGLWERCPSHRPCASWSWCILSLPGSHPPEVPCYRAHFSNAFPAKPGGLLRRHLQEIAVCPSRLKGSKRSKKKNRQTLQDEEEEEEEEEEDENSSDLEGEDDQSAPKDYKDLDKVVQSFRYDIVMKAGLDISRHKVEDAFYGNQLRLNGEKLWKKSRTVKVGDTLDLIVGQDKETEAITVMRVILKNVSSEKTETDKHRVVLRRWKNLKIPQEQLPK
ncbi:uncharacterized protein C6orf203 homolog [Rhinatrema bivittatum]|uniref:uncharacterized protein C6orf203 homolog n=1 Tax=Rhinatrema bivittatum TaxID=194408 RepID=UPI00112E4678|nr:uncharacterized protein C6orf203 homolog [Rhinatrema bivittatum]